MSGEIPFYAAGNLTRDPELRFTAEGKPVAGLAMAVTPRRYDQASSERGELAEVRAPQRTAGPVLRPSLYLRVPAVPGVREGSRTHAMPAATTGCDVWEPSTCGSGGRTAGGRECGGSTPATPPRRLTGCRTRG
jgi:hypothetical protein